jgi:hypothetical protein
MTRVSQVASPPSAHAISEVSMIRPLLKLLVLALVAALLASSQCYASCAAFPCSAPIPPDSHCHHHSQRSDSSGRSCEHPHSDFFSPQAGADYANLAVFEFAGSIELSCSGIVVGSAFQPAVALLKRSCDAGHSARSVLELLASLRI